MAYRNPTKCCSDRDILNLYKWMDNGRYDKIVNLLTERNIFVLAENNDFFTKSDQGRGVFIFTDTDRASRFLAQDENAGPGVYFERAPFIPTWFRAADGMLLDIYVNLTPAGDKDAFMHWICDKDIWQLGCKDRKMRYTLPFGLHAHWMERWGENPDTYQVPRNY